MIQELWKLLDGKKTYLISVIWLLAGFGVSIGVVNKEQYDALTLILFPAGLAALRSGVGK